MAILRLKYLPALLLACFFAFQAPVCIAQEHEAVPEKLDAGEVIFDHVSDAHEYHFFTLKNEKNPHESKHFSIPLPVILYQKGKGWDIFLSSAFHHGQEAHNGYRLVDIEYLKESK